MKILYFIDSLGAGGVQRQMPQLVIDFKEKRYEVSFFLIMILTSLTQNCMKTEFR